MGITKISQKFVTQVGPDRMFKALILDSHNICPKLMFSSIQSIHFIQGDGDVGSIKQINFTEASPYKYVKYRIDALDKEGLMSKYTLIEGDPLSGKLEYVSHEVKFEGYGTGGCICSVTSEYKAKEGIQIKEEDIEHGKDRAIAKLKNIIKNMGVTRYTQEFPCPISPSRMFKALIVDSHLLIPKLLPQFIASVDVIQGDGGPGSIEQVNFTQASPFKYVKHRIDELDHSNYVCKYTLIEGDALGDKLESIAYEVKFEQAIEGGCICKIISKYNTIEDFEVKEEEIKEGKDKAIGIYKVVEAYLLQNPLVYA